MKLTLLIIAGLMSMSLANKFCADGEQPAPLTTQSPPKAPATVSVSSSDEKKVKKWSIKELFSSDSTNNNQMVGMMKALKLLGFVGLPGLRALIDAKLRRIGKASLQSNMGKYSQQSNIGIDSWQRNMGNGGWRSNIGKDGWNNHEYAVGYDSYGIPGYWPVQQKIDTMSSIGIKPMFADKFEFPQGLLHKSTKGKF